MKPKKRIKNRIKEKQKGKSLFPTGTREEEKMSEQVFGVKLPISYADKFNENFTSGERTAVMRNLLKQFIDGKIRLLV